MTIDMEQFFLPVSTYFIELSNKYLSSIHVINGVCMSTQDL